MSEKELETMEQEDEIIVLQNDEGEEVEFRQIATFDYNNDWYIFLQPVELGDLEEDQVLVFRIDADEEGNDIFEPIEDETLLDALEQEYLKLVDEEDPCANCADESCEGCVCADCEEESCKDCENKD